MVAQALRSPSEAPSEPLPDELRAAVQLLLDAARAGDGAALVIVTIDDAQWIDEASAEPLMFAFRRLAGTRVAVLIGVRSGATTPFVDSGLPRLRGAVASALTPTPAPETPQGLLDGADAA